jgi:hypothetical protein
VIQKGTTWWEVLHRYGKHDCTKIESIDAFLQVDKCKWDARYYHFDDDPIYDTENDEHEIAEFWPYEQPSFHITGTTIFTGAEWEFPHSRFNRSYSIMDILNQ